MNISVIVCCYNSESRIKPTLEALEQQVLPEGIRFEVIIVDNNCSDETVARSLETWKREEVPLKIIEETTPGLSSARKAGCIAAEGDFIVYCDDDNWLDPDYLRHSHDFMSQHPEFAAIGGWGEVTSDIEIPDWFSEFETKYACGKTRANGEVDTLVGAGIFLRRDAIVELQSSGFVSALSDRKGSALSSGGDLELSLALRIAGWKVYFSEKLYFRHYMSKDRLTEEYLIRMSEGHGRSRSVLGEYRAALKVSPPSLYMLYFIEVYLRLQLRVIRYRITGWERRDVESLSQRVDYATNSGSFEGDSELLSGGGIFSLTRRLWDNFRILIRSRATEL